MSTEALQLRNARSATKLVRPVQGGRRMIAKPVSWVIILKTADATPHVPLPSTLIRSPNTAYNVIQIVKVVQGIGKMTALNAFQEKNQKMEFVLIDVVTINFMMGSLVLSAILIASNASVKRPINALHAPREIT